MINISSFSLKYSVIVLLSSLHIALANDDGVLPDNSEESGKGYQEYEKKKSIFQLPTIEVKGYVFKQKLEDTSGSVNIYTQEDISRTHSTTLNELIKNTPGFQSMAFAIVDFMIIRGTGSMYDLKGKSHAVFYNGIPLTSTESKNLTLSDDIASVEVLKGPQHILYGSSARSGAIDIRTKKSNKTEGTISFGFGNDNIRNFSLNQNVKMNEYLNIGFGFDRIHDGGFIDNLTTGQKKGGFTADNYRLKTSISPNPNTSIDLYYSLQKVNSKKPTLVSLNRNLEPVLYNISNFDEARTPILEGPLLGGFWKERTDFGGVDSRSTRSFSASVEHYFQPNLHLNYVYSRSKFFQNTDLDLDFTDIPLFDFIGATKVSHDYTSSSQYHDIRLIGEHDLFKWIVGLSKTRDRNKRIASGHPFGVTIRAMRMGDKVDGRSIYTQWKFIPSKYIDFVLGFRRQVDKVYPEYLPISDNEKINNLFDKHVQPFIDGIKGGALPESYSSSANLWSGTATMHFTPEINLYTTVSKGYVSAGYQSFITNSLVRPERGISREVGFKANLFNSRLFLVGAAYRNEYQDYQFFNFLKYSLENIPQFKATGSEFAAYFVASPNIIIGATHSKVNPKILDYKMQDAFGLMDTGIYDAYSDLTTFKNKVIPWVPKSNTSADLILSGRVKEVDVVWTNTISRRGKMYIDFGNKLSLKPLNIFDSSIQLKKGKDEVIIWGKNLTNKKYFTNAFSSGLSLGTYGRSRSFGITYKKKL